MIDEKGWCFVDPDFGVAAIKKGTLYYKTMGRRYDEVIKRDLPCIKSRTSETYEEALDATQCH